MPSSAAESRPMIQPQFEVEQLLAEGKLTGWRAAAFVELRDKVADDAFPCTFGTTALRKGYLLFAFVEGVAEAEGVIGLAAALKEYAGFVRRYSIVQASMMPLAVFMPAPSNWRTLEDYFHNSSRLLQKVHERDSQPWPERLARDPDDPRWSFCFDGVPFFVNFKTPLHRARRSRRTQHSYLWLVQVRDGFDVVAGDTPQGRNARRIIREKLAAYDEVPVYPELAHYGDTANREWKQYFVPETNEPIAARCPFHNVR